MIGERFRFWNNNGNTPENGPENKAPLSEREKAEIRNRIKGLEELIFNITGGLGGPEAAYRDGKYSQDDNRISEWHKAIAKLKAELGEENIEGKKAA